MSKDLKIIKRKYGEKMARYCRDNFSTILEIEGLLCKILLDNFNTSHILFDDIINNHKLNEFNNYILGLIKLEEQKFNTMGKTPEQLMSQAGYRLKECKTNEEIMMYQRYYAKNEELCTFRSQRIKECRVFFAVHEDAEKLRREEFKNPSRQDKYGTSVISIQFKKDGTNCLSIKNRYNESVPRPDATFSNNLDNIVVGLTQAFEITYGLVQKYKNIDFSLPNYVRAVDGKFYRYNYATNGTYYCHDNVIIKDNKIIKLDKSKYLVVDYFIISLVDKKIIDLNGNKDSFTKIIPNIKLIEIKKCDGDKIISIQGHHDEKIYLNIDKYNVITSLKLENIENIPDNFLFNNNTLEFFIAHKLKYIGSWFMTNNKVIRKFITPDLLKIGNEFLRSSLNINKLELPNLEEAGDGFLTNAILLNELTLEKVRIIGNRCLVNNKYLQNLYLPNIEQIGDGFLEFNKSLQLLEIPRKEVLGRRCLLNNENCSISMIENSKIKKKTLEKNR